MKSIEVKNSKDFIVDDADYAELSKYKWYLANGYARRTEYVSYIDRKQTQRIHYMHRQILNAPAVKEVDHINGNRTDNRRANLRLATRPQNAINKVKPPSNNTSGYIGVIWQDKPRGGKWHSRIQVNGRALHLGCFTDLKQAIKARKDAEVKYFGEFSSQKVMV